VEGVAVDLKRAMDVNPDDAAGANGYAFGTHSASCIWKENSESSFEKLIPYKKMN